MAATEQAPDYRRSPVPRYLQVAAAIRQRIEDGYWAANEKIATLAELEQEFAVARVTVRQAVELLEQEGLLLRQQGKGTFVSSEVEDKRWLKLDLKWSSIARTIGENVPRFMPVDERVEPVIEPEDGTRAERYYYFESVQSRHGEPFALARVHVAEHVVALAPQRFQTEPAIAVIADLPQLEIGAARQTFVIRAADTRIAGHLEIGIGFPTADAHLVVTDAAGVVIYVGDISYRGDCVRLDVDMLR